MCGIAGGWFFRAVDRNRLERSAAQLHHRGPDAQAVFVDQSVGLVHTRLSIIDVIGGDQPLHSPDGQLHLVANGEIYNYPEVLSQARARGYHPLSGSDCESLMAVYRHAGLSGLRELNGMFAFALYDQAAQALILGRDRLGIKPLFYAQTSDGVFFASEIKALLPLLPRQATLNPAALRQFLDYQFHTGRDTVFPAIKRVLPGECVCITRDSLSHQHYWQLSDVRPQTPSLSLAQAQEAFEPLFAQVMREHQRSDVPFGLFLSGGIDSSILLSALSAERQEPLKTYSIGYEGTDQADELAAAASLAKQFGTEHRELRVGREALFERIVHTIWATDDLMRDYACLPTSLLSEAAAGELKVVFSGEGGDEAFAGYRRYAPGLESQLKALCFGLGGIRRGSQWSGLARRHWLGSRLRGVDARQAVGEAWQQCPKDWSLMAKKQAVDIGTALPDNLFVKADRVMMAFGLEGRVPLADHRLVEFGLSLPDGIKYQQGRGKYLLRQWAKNQLGEAHLQKPKSGFYVPVNGWLRGDFLTQLGQKLRHNKSVNEWFEPQGLERVLKAHQAGQSHSRELWGVMQFAIWHKLFVETPGVIPSVRENPLDWL